jgi:hypothetical protein
LAKKIASDPVLFSEPAFCQELTSAMHSRNRKKILLGHVHPSEQLSIHREEISPRVYYEIKNAFDGQV